MACRAYIGAEGREGGNLQQGTLDSSIFIIRERTVNKFYKIAAVRLYVYVLVSVLHCEESIEEDHCLFSATSRVALANARASSIVG